MLNLLTTALALPTFIGAQVRALQAPDIDGHGSIHAFHHVAQDTSWLAHANFYVTQGGSAQRAQNGRS